MWLKGSDIMIGLITFACGAPQSIDDLASYYTIITEKNYHPKN